MVARRYTPNRGEVVWVQLDPVAGREQRGKRPAVVLTPKAYNKAAGLMLACPITSQVKGYPFEVAVTAGAVTGVALVDQIRSLDWQRRRVEFVARASEQTMHDIQKKIQLLVL